MNWSCKLTLWQRERDGGGGQTPGKSEVRAQNNTVCRFWFFWGGDAREYPGGLLRLDPAFAYAEPPSSWPLSRVPLSMGFSRQEYWSGLPFPSPGIKLIINNKDELMWINFTCILIDTDKFFLYSKKIYQSFLSPVFAEREDISNFILHFQFYFNRKF